MIEADLLPSRLPRGMVFTGRWSQAHAVAGSIGPATETPSRVGLADAAPIGAAAVSAYAAQRGWDGTTADARASVLPRVLELCRAHRDDLAPCGQCKPGPGTERWFWRKACTTVRRSA